ncbi:MAG: hypothetical protein A2104_05120 [Candidatus Melainabacteria bacterium GWF2_32_7]|nr:MAG: hypothetical protein A2104_05120 [Candidatus Melainabacteria bacterium GWF2_32_7]
MIKIRKLKPADIRKIQEMVEYIQPGHSSSFVSEDYFTLFPLDLFHNLLPPNMRFLQECFVAAEDKNLLGLIGLVPDGQQKTRWKINRLILDINAYEIGQQLIDFVVNRYGGSGVETFITTIDEKYPEAISLFKNACKFRSCSHIHIWEKDNLEINTDFKNIGLLREVKISDASKLRELDAQTLFPQFRTSLIKNIADYKFGLKNKIFNQIKGFKIKRFVLDNPGINSIEGYVLIMSKDNKNFWADIILSLAYQDYYEDILNYIIRYVKSQNENAKLHVYSRKYYQSNKKLVEVLAKQNFKPSHSFQVLVKDYWKITPVTSEDKKSPIIIFPDITSPACNSLKMNKFGR